MKPNKKPNPIKRMGNSFAESNSYGKLILLIGLLVAVPLILLPFYPDERKHAPAFLIPALSSFILGLLICLFAPRRDDSSDAVHEWQSPLQKGSLPVMLAWGFAFIAGAVPFVIGGYLNPLHALFESVSGWTTTGMTVADVTTLPKIFLLHRAFMQYCGGLGFIIMIAMLIQGKQNMNLYNAEGHPDRLTPSLKKTAQVIFSLYSCFSAAGVIIYRIFGMELFDAVCHTMSALSTAGFTTQANSIGQYQSLPIEIITIVLMIIGSTNFAILLLLVKGKFLQAFKVSEFKFMLGLVLIFTSLTAFSLINQAGMSFGEGVKNSLFGVVTTFTTSGYSITDYAAWPPFALGLLMPLMIIGGSAGSTAGGIKLIRTHLLIKIAKENVRNRISPARRITSPSYYRVQGRARIDDALIKDTIGFITCYIAVYIIGMLALTLTAGSSPFDAAFEFGSALGTVGLSNGIASPDASAGTLLVLMAGMILGRLEIFIVFIGLYSGFKLIKRSLNRKRL